jgi:hypothetical protein
MMMELEEKTFICSCCSAERDLDDLPRVTLMVSIGIVGLPWTQLLCWQCLENLIKLLHNDYCSQDCKEQHEVHRQ